VKIPKTGLLTVGVLLILTLVSLGLQAAARARLTEPKIPVPPAKIGKWTAKPGQPPQLDVERDTPPAVYYLYTFGNLPPVRVSIARVTTLDTFRGPFAYLFDTDGRLKDNMKVLVPRKGQKEPLHMMALAAGHDEMALLFHWVQSPGEDPIPEPTEALGQVIGTAWMHRPAFVCDVWISYRADAGSSLSEAHMKMDEILTEISDAIDAKIKALRVK
jgi:hypothetical protein